MQTVTQSLCASLVPRLLRGNALCLYECVCVSVWVCVCMCVTGHVTEFMLPSRREVEQGVFNFQLLEGIGQLSMFSMLFLTSLSLSLLLDVSIGSLAPLGSRISGATPIFLFSLLPTSWLTYNHFILTHLIRNYLSWSLYPLTMFSSNNLCATFHHYYVYRQAFKMINDINASFELSEGSAGWWIKATSTFCFSVSSHTGPDLVDLLSLILHVLIEK